MQSEVVYFVDLVVNYTKGIAVLTVTQIFSSDFGQQWFKHIELHKRLYGVLITHSTCILPLLYANVS